MIRNFSLIILAIIISACTPPPTLPSTPTETSIPPSTPTPESSVTSWWNDVVFYEIFVRSFYDSNGDGIGDFNGILEKLDYLNDGDPNTISDLGITAIWLMPIHPSPSTHGYDITDYYAVNPQYGTMDDFQSLVADCHRRGIRVIIDLVLNHTSNQHPWFIQSQDPQSPYRNWYVWSDTNPGYLGFWNQQVWYPSDSGYYYSFFWEGMPDLNYTNPEVTAEMENVTRFWLQDIGIDGFRLDAIGSLIENGQETVETTTTHDWFKEYFQFYKAINPEAITVGEVWRTDDIVVPYVTNKEVDLAFEFDLSAAILASVNNGTAAEIISTLQNSTSHFPAGQYGTFITNHDMARVMTQFGDELGKGKVAASLYLTLPGVPFIYYGEEIGMTGDAPDEQGRRPMQWNTESYAGFSTIEPWKPIDENYSSVNVASETNNPDSLLSHYRTLIFLRNHHPALRGNDMIIIPSENPSVFASIRFSNQELMFILINLAGTPITGYNLSLSMSELSQGNYTPVTLLGVESTIPLQIMGNGGFLGYVPFPEIPAYSTTIIQLIQK